VRVGGFTAESDIVGRRVKVSWEVRLNEGEGMGAAPALVLRRKERDFEFPAPGVDDDPFLVYASGAFPPAVGTVTEIDLGPAVEQGVRTMTTVDSVAVPIDGVPVEVLRRTRTVSFDSARNPTGYRDEILDVAARAEGLQPGTTYYYELLGPPVPEDDPDAFRAVATPTEVHRSGRMLYDQLPAIVRRHDVTKGPALDTGAVPEASPENGQLRRFVDLFGAGFDHLRSRADGLRELHAVDTVDYRMLPHMAAWLGWDLSHDKPIPLQRHEIKYAAALYRITGTLPGSMIWVKRLTGWDARVKEFWRNVFFTNDLGNPDDPDDRGSRTLDTSDEALLAGMGTYDDRVDYISDSGTGQDARYSLTTVGVFATPEPGDDAATVVQKRARVVQNAGVFLPFNLRAVVVIETDTVAAVDDETLGLTRAEDAIA
jgi:phage tail-like protein